MRRSLRVLSVVALAVAGVVTTPVVADAAVDTTCTFSKAKKLVTVTLPDADADETPVWFGRVPGTKRLGFDTWSIDWRACGRATVTNTDKVRIVGTSQNESVVITLVGGALAPGASRERTGSSELEIVGDLGPGTDTLELEGGNGNDRLAFRSRTQSMLNGDADVDVILADVDDWELSGGLGNDVLDGRGAPQVEARGLEGSDRVYGSRGEDLLYGDDGASPDADGNDVLVGGGGDDSLYGGGGNDRLVGGDGDDYLRPEAGRDVALGGADEDYLASESTPDGADTFSGGSDDDSVTYSSRTKPLRISLDGRANDGARGEGDDVRGDVEGVEGGAKADVLTGSAADNWIHGNGGGDTLLGGAGDDSLRPGDGDDVVRGGDGDDYLEPSAGSDRYLGDAGDDRLYGGSAADGRDVYSGGAGHDELSYSQRVNPVTIDVTDNGDDGEAGENDKVTADFEVIYGGSGGDTVQGGRLAETIVGNNGNDTLSGGRGADYLSGGSGDDTLNGGEGYDRVYGSDGDDTLSAIDGAQDYLDCGSHVGGDLAYVDDFDSQTGCEALVA